jgi:shikimate dehydrogenase
MTDKYAVVGNPVEHSLSPEIHAAFARETGQDVSYGRIRAPLDAFKAVVAKFRDEGGSGLNVTLPFKHEAWSMAGSRKGYALDAEAVNTIKFLGDGLEGHNTDGIGLLADIERNLAYPVGGRRVLLMGAGGATYGVMHPLLAAHPDLLVVANRTPDKATTLVAHFRKFERLAARGLSAKPYDALAGESFDLVINATSAGLRDEMPALPAGVFAPGALAYDMVYGKETPFLKFAAERGARTADGLGMLVEQAAESFFIWRGVRPATKPVIDRLRREGGRRKDEGGNK